MPGVRLGNHVLRLEPFSVCIHKSRPCVRWDSASHVAVVPKLGLQSRSKLVRLFVILQTHYTIALQLGMLCSSDWNRGTTLVIHDLMTHCLDVRLDVSSRCV
ncbi:TPA: hypothetical protein ACH3X1_014332 [Trebouxia sp. C0004]